MNVNGNLDISQIGNLHFILELGHGRSLLDIKTSGMDHTGLLGNTLGEDLIKTYPVLMGLTIKGQTGFHINVMTDNMREWFLKGTLHSSVPLISLPALDLTISDLNMDLPFDLASPSCLWNSPQEEQEGTISIRDISWDKRSFKDIDLHPLFSLNRFRIKDPISLKIWGGKVSLANIRGEDIASQEASFYASIRIKGLNLENIFEGSGFLLPGILDGEILHMRYKMDRLDLDGSLDAEVLGGIVSASGLYMENPFNTARRFGGNIFWEGIQLEHLTQKIPIGKMSGVIRGFLTGLVIEYGQPSKFLFEVETVKRKGIKQKISVDAIKNLSLIGTGSSGVRTVLNSGLNRFFSYYPYSKIGLQCKLENDLFTLRGLIRKGGQEFLIRKGLFRGIDMVNQNPNNIIRFKDMKERINRIFQEREKAVRVN